YPIDNPSDRFILLDDLARVKTEMYEMFDDLVTVISRDSDFKFDDTTRRTVIGFFIQRVIERVYEVMIDHYKPENVMVVGGLHYNVKLNNLIMKSIPGVFCAMPLAGDQGAAIGLYRKLNGTLKMPTLCIGRRNLIVPETTKTIGVRTTSELVDAVVDRVSRDDVVQVVAGNMEFGPRALCNTSTFALPKECNVDLINHVNGRNTVMPMAPVMLRRNLDCFFSPEQYSRVVGSDKYMILTYDYHHDKVEKYLGVAHRYPLSNRYSGRPQVVDTSDGYIYDVLDRLESKTRVKAIINTSFNVHGRPIVFSVEDAVDDHKYQREQLRSSDISKDMLSLVILEGENEIV
ncbi:MAG: carbamoyltransferase C-terminal domain-containing protein, partial [bacterium]